MNCRVGSGRIDPVFGLSLSQSQAHAMPISKSQPPETASRATQCRMFRFSGCSRSHATIYHAPPRSLTSAVNRRCIFSHPAILPISHPALANRFPQIDPSQTESSSITAVQPKTSSTSVVILGWSRPSSEILQPLQPYKGKGVGVQRGAMDDLYIPRLI